MLIYDKYLDSYYEVIPVKKIEEKIEELDKAIEKILKDGYERNTTGMRMQIDILQELIKENSEEE